MIGIEQSDRTHDTNTMKKQPQLYMVFASYGRSNGWAVFRAEDKKSARRYAKNSDWLVNARVDYVQTLRQYYDDAAGIARDTTTSGCRAERSQEVEKAQSRGVHRDRLGDVSLYVSTGGGRELTLPPQIMLTCPTVNYLSVKQKAFEHAYIRPSFFLIH